MAKTENALVVCARNWPKGKPGNEPGPVRYFEVEPGQKLEESQALKPKEWTTKVREYSAVDEDNDGYAIGDVLFYVHGYNGDTGGMLRRHFEIQTRLKELGSDCLVVSFDWPSASSTLNYIEDRTDAKKTAFKLVSHAIKPLAYSQRDQDIYKCDINVHLLGHSTGAYLIREAFDHASDVWSINDIGWSVQQMILIGADISADSLSEDAVNAPGSKTRAMVRHAKRITNYSNGFDTALKVSNIKRVGTAPRVGRKGLPQPIIPNAVNVDCSDYWQSVWKSEDKLPKGDGGNVSHSWHFFDSVFMQDLAWTISDDVDRVHLPTRTMIDGRLRLRAP